MIALTPFHIEDYANLVNWVENEKQLIQFSGDFFKFPVDRAQIMIYLADPKRVAYKVIFNEKAIGHSEIYKEDEHSVKLGRILIGEPSLRGRGIGQQLIYRLLTEAFSNMAIMHVQLNVYDWNTAAIKCYEKVGFRVNPNITSQIRVDDEVWKSINMTIDRARWQTLLPHNDSV